MELECPCDLTCRWTRCAFLRHGLFSLNSFQSLSMNWALLLSQCRDIHIYLYTHTTMQMFRSCRPLPATPVLSAGTHTHIYGTRYTKCRERCVGVIPSIAWGGEGGVVVIPSMGGGGWTDLSIFGLVGGCWPVVKLLKLLVLHSLLSNKHDKSVSVLSVHSNEPWYKVSQSVFCLFTAVSPHIQSVNQCFVCSQQWALVYSQSVFCLFTAMSPGIKSVNQSISVLSVHSSEPWYKVSQSINQCFVCSQQWALVYSRSVSVLSVHSNEPSYKPFVVD